MCTYIYIYIYIYTYKYIGPEGVVVAHVQGPAAAADAEALPADVLAEARVA